LVLKGVWEGGRFGGMEGRGPKWGGSLKAGDLLVVGWIGVRGLAQAERKKGEREVWVRALLSPRRRKGAQQRLMIRLLCWLRGEEEVALIPPHPFISLEDGGIELSFPSPKTNV
jgi:hypothetical protein